MTVLGGAMANNLANYSKRHPYQANRSLIDWDVILMLEPTTIAGAILGALLHELLPALLIVVMLLVLLLLMAYLTLTKAIKLYRKETQAQQLSAAAFTNDEETQKLVVSLQQTMTAGAFSQAFVSYGAATIHGGASEQIQDDKLLGYSAHGNMMDAVKLTALFAIVTAINLFKGDLEDSKPLIVDATVPANYVMSLPECGTTCFWVSNIAILVVVTVFVVWTRHVLLLRLAQGGSAVSDIAWNEFNTFRYPVYAIFAGIVAGLFGIGKYKE
jgi:uncharacterized membrane protein YfcA